MPEATAVPAPVQEPIKAPPQQPPQGAAALAVEDVKKEAQLVDDPYEYDLDIKGQKQKIKFTGKDQMKAVLQKALYADQTIKDAVQARKGAESLMQKIKTADGLKEVLRDPEIAFDLKKFVLDEVRAMMDDERLSPEEREARQNKTELQKLKEWKAQQEQVEADKVKQEKINKEATVVRGQIIDAMKKYPDIPQTQATMDACILNMRAAFKRFGKHITPEQAMTVYSQQYWTSLSKVLETMEPDVMVKKFGQKAFDRIQKFKLDQLKEKMNPNKNSLTKDEVDVKKKKNLTEKEYDKIFQQRIAGL